jgi:hypothetical protein
MDDNEQPTSPRCRLLLLLLPGIAAAPSLCAAPEQDQHRRSTRIRPLLYGEAAVIAGAPVSAGRGRGRGRETAVRKALSFNRRSTGARLDESSLRG